MNKSPTAQTNARGETRGVWVEGGDEVVNGEGKEKKGGGGVQVRQLVIG